MSETPTTPPSNSGFSKDVRGIADRLQSMWRKTPLVEDEKQKGHFRLDKQAEENRREFVEALNQQLLETAEGDLQKQVDDFERNKARDEALVQGDEEVNINGLDFIVSREEMNQKRGRTLEYKVRERMVRETEQRRLVQEREASGGVDVETERPEKEFLMNPQYKPSALREAAGIIAQRIMSGEINSVDSLLQGVVSDNKVLQVLVETNVNLTLVQSLEAVEQALDLKEDPPARKEYRTRLRARLEELSPRERVREINRLFDVFDFCLLVGEMPSTDLVPERVGFWQAARDLVKIAREQRSKLKALANGNREMERLVTELRTSDPEIFLTSVDRAGAEEVEVEELEGLLDLDRGFNRGQGIEAYMFTPQTRELMKKMWGLDEVGKRSLWYSRLVGTGIRGGGGLLPFILRAASQDFGAPTEEAALNKALEWVAKEAQVRGYHSPEDVHKMVGFFEPEELGELAQKEICFKVWVEGEDKPREFTLGAKHVLAEMFDADILAELEANKGLGFFGARFARGRLLRRVIWKRMGYSQEDISRWEERERNYKGKAQMLRDQGKPEEAKRLEGGYADIQEDKLPQIYRTDKLSLSEQLEIDSLDLLIGDNWWMIQMAEAIMRLSRSDLKLIPLEEAARTEWQAFRKWRPDYARTYALVKPPVQQLGAITLLPPYMDRIAPKALVAPLAEAITLQLDNVGNDKKDFVRRYVDSLVMVDQVSPAAARLMGKAALGYADFIPEGDSVDDRVASFKKKFGARMNVIERLGIKQLRDFSSWGVAEESFNIDDRRRFGELIVDAKVDFSPMLLRAGVTQREIDGIKKDSGNEAVVGSAGWRLLLNRASLLMMDLSAGGYKDEDSSTRYSVPAESAVTSTQKMVSAWDFEEDKIAGRDTKKVFVSASVASDLGLPADRPMIDNVKQLPSDVSPNESEARTFFSAQYGKAMGNLAKLAAEFSPEGFLDNEQTRNVYSTAVRLFANTHLAWSLDTYVEDVEKDKVGPGLSFSTRRITRGEFERRWTLLLSGHKGDVIDGLDDGAKNQLVNLMKEDTREAVEAGVREVERVFEAWGFRFVGVAEWVADASERASQVDRAVLVGPNSTHVPAVIKARNLFTALEKETDKLLSVISGGSEPYNFGVRFLERLKRMKGDNYFCWSRLVDGAINLTPHEIIRVLLDSMDTTSSMPDSVVDQLRIEYAALQEHGVVSDWMFADRFLARVKFIGKWARFSENTFTNQPVSPTEIEIKMR